MFRLVLLVEVLLFVGLCLFCVYEGISIYWKVVIPFVEGVVVAFVVIVILDRCIIWLGRKSDD